MPKVIKKAKDKPENEEESESTIFPDRAKERFDADSIKSYYANSVEIRSSLWDFRFKCGEMVDATAEKIFIKDLCVLYMSPSHAKAVSILLARQVKAYEDRFGEIPTPPL